MSNQTNAGRRADLERRIECARAEGKFAIAKALAEALNDLPRLETSEPPPKPVANLTPPPPKAVVVQAPELTGLARAVAANASHSTARHVEHNREPLTGLQKAIQANIKATKEKNQC